MRARTSRHRWTAIGVLLAVLPAASAERAAAQAAADAAAPVDRLRDRGEGLPTSLCGTYVRGGELLVYPFYEYYRDEDFEYAPADLGFPGDTDVRGRYRAHEGLVYFAYGITDDVAVEFEAAVIDATLRKSPDDRSALPPTIAESGLGDIEGQLRWRWRRETGAVARLAAGLPAIQQRVRAHVESHRLGARGRGRFLPGPAVG